MVRTLTLISLALATGGPAYVQNRPEALERLFAGRAALQTALVHIKYDDPRYGEPINYTLRATGSETALVNWGNDQGVVARDPGRDGRPHSTLRDTEYTYAHDHEGAFLMRSGLGSDAREGVMFVRALGTTLRAPWGIDIDQALFRDANLSQPIPVTYEEFSEGPLSVVRSRIGRETQTWWLDPARDYMPVRIVYCADGEPPAETRIELDQFDGVWFPRTITSYANGQVTQSVHVIGAEFNRAEHPAHLTPADIGIEPGMVIMDLLAEQGDPVWVWGGERAITLEQFGELERSGQIERGPANQAFLDAALADMRARGITPGWRADSTGADQRPAGATTDMPRTARGMMSEWERYTREFIATHKLDAKQTERAWSTLQNCQRQAARYIAARRNDIEETERKLDAASADAAQASTRRTETLRQRLAQLVGPIDEIFENRLKPGLDRLLTKEQRDQTPNRRGDADRGGD